MGPTNLYQDANTLLFSITFCLVVTELVIPKHFFLMDSQPTVTSKFGVGGVLSWKKSKVGKVFDQKGKAWGRRHREVAMVKLADRKNWIEDRRART